MAKIDPFERHSGRYEEWFEKHGPAYRAELRAVGELLPQAGRGVEIGVGSARFAGPLGVRHGVDPSPRMASLARARGIDVAVAVGESLPYRGGTFDFALMVTTICFLDDVRQSFMETRRILRPGGALIVGFVDRSSFLGRYYEHRRDRSVFYRAATFYSTEEVLGIMAAVGFGGFSFRQTLFSMPRRVRDGEAVKEGHGQGAFVVVRGVGGAEYLRGSG